MIKERIKIIFGSLNLDNFYLGEFLLNRILVSRIFI